MHARVVLRVVGRVQEDVGDGVLMSAMLREQDWGRQDEGFGVGRRAAERYVESKTKEAEELEMGTRG